MTRTIPRATASESLRFALWHRVPALLRGTYATNPRLTRLMARLGADRRAAALLDGMRTRYGGRSVWVAGATGRALLIVSSGDLRQVLGAPDHVFSPATRARVRGLGLVEPHALTVTDRRDDRGDRRRFTEAVLDTATMDHARVRSVVAGEVGALLATTSRFTWPAADAAVGRIARRLVLGDDARDDTIVTRLNRALLHDANWCGRRPFRAHLDAALRRALRTRVGRYVAAGQDGLAARIHDAPATVRTDPAGQVPYWLASFDPLADLVTYALARLAHSPGDAGTAEAEAAADGGPRPYLTACLLEAARLRPPVPDLARVVTAPVPWHGDRLPAGTDVLIPLAWHLRGPGGAHAGGFAPHRWLDGTAERAAWAASLTGGCPGAGLGLLAGAEMLAALLDTARFEPVAPPATGGVPAAHDVRAIRMVIHSPVWRAVPRQRRPGRPAARTGPHRR